MELALSEEIGGGLRVAVVGGGVSGLSAAYLLSRRHRVELFERDPRLGGHAHTHIVEHQGREWHLDSGFLVYNHRTYPRFVRLLAELGVGGQRSEMSFSVHCRRCRLQYSTRGLNGLFSQRRRALDPGHLGMLRDIPRFNRRARALLDHPEAPDSSLGEFLQEGRFGERFARHFLLPLVGAVWSSSAADVRGFSARSLLRFMDNHGWLTVDPPRWWTVRGGSRRYVHAIARRLGGSVHLGCGVVALRREASGVQILLDRGEWRRFDKVVLATHADQALRLLSDPSGEESRLLGAFRYARNRALLHTDGGALPRSPRARASWNMEMSDCRREVAPVAITYHLNRLQALPGSTPFCVSLNVEREPAPGTVLAEMDYTHPILDAAAVAAQPELRRLSGQRHTLFAGAHLRYGFHEDGLLSGMKAAEALGGGFEKEEAVSRSREHAACSGPAGAAPRRSSLCEGWVSHHRRGQTAHAFRYRVFLTLLDLDELPALGRELRLFGHNRPRPVSFRDQDHLGASGNGVRRDLEATVRAQGYELPDGRVELLTLCRLFGYVFNPVSFFYCYDGEGRLALTVAEVNNNYGDRHSYVLPVEDAAFRWRTKKVMHVSPFFPPDAGSYRWDLPPPGDRVEVGVDLTRDGHTQLRARLSLGRRPLTDAALASALVRYPFLTVKVMGAIHFEALRLFAKGLRFWARPPHDPELARGGPA